MEPLGTGKPTTNAKDTVSVKADFLPVDQVTFFEQLQASEYPTYQIGSDQTSQPKAAGGTQVSMANSTLLNQDGSLAEYIYNVEIVEILKPRDMLRYRIPTVSSGQLLETAGSILVRAKKQNINLVPNPGNPPLITVRTPYDAKMQVYNGARDGQGRFDWQLLPNSGITQSLDNNKKVDGYKFFPNKFGFINIDKLYEFKEQKVNVEFVSTYPKVDNICTFLMFKDISSLVQVYEGRSIPLPAGKSAKVICIAETTDKQIFFYTTDITIKEGLSVKIQLTKSSLQNLNTFINSL
ncbi:MAG: hypothetical protein ACRCVT_06150 [Leadbetterella sp.]